MLSRNNPISYETANKIVSIANDVSNVINNGRMRNDVIGYTEPAFVRGLNSQIKLALGLVWDGKPGSDIE